MKLTAIAGLLSVIAINAHADESLFGIETGTGYSEAQGVHDGIWVQEGLSHDQSLNAPSFMLGLTGDILNKGPWSLSYHADYVYTGTINVQAMAVADADYNTHTKMAVSGSPQTRFSGSGHTQGLALTLAPGYNISDWRLQVEGGAFLFWQTWHEAVYLNPVVVVDHRTTPEVTWTAGASISKGPLSLSYRYFNKSQSWNPAPQYTSGEQLLLVTYRF
jgi:hypothetical protein